jgi:hypothetical protein
MAYTFAHLSNKSQIHVFHASICSACVSVGLNHCTLVHFLNAVASAEGRKTGVSFFS